MTLINSLDLMTIWQKDFTLWTGQFVSNSTVFAQQVDVDLWTNVQNTWQNLLKTGQLWAFLIGMGMGWWAKSLFP